jgi:succinate dehydrogenase / fumarate reductase cytochrome b subunit
MAATAPANSVGTPVRTAARKRPMFLNLAALRYPVGAIASVGHRISGVLLLVALPALAAALERSLRSAGDYAALLGSGRPVWLTITLIVLAWATAHHVVAGVRHLLMDIGIGSGLPAARASAWAALVLGALAAVVAGARMLS